MVKLSASVMLAGSGKKIVCELPLHVTDVVPPNATLLSKSTPITVGNSVFIADPPTAIARRARFSLKYTLFPPFQSKSRQAQLRTLHAPPRFYGATDIPTGRN